MLEIRQPVRLRDLWFTDTTLGGVIGDIGAVQGEKLTASYLAQTTWNKKLEKVGRDKR